MAFCRMPEIPTSKFSGVLKQQRFENVVFTISEIPHSIFLKHIFA